MLRRIVKSPQCNILDTTLDILSFIRMVGAGFLQNYTNEFKHIYQLFLFQYSMFNFLPHIEGIRIHSNSDIINAYIYNS